MLIANDSFANRRYETARRSAAIGRGKCLQDRLLDHEPLAHADLVPDISLAGVSRSRAAVAEMATGARLVKSISNMPMDWIQDFSVNKPRTVIFTSGDDIEAKQVVIGLIDSTGLVAIDLGPLANGHLHQVGAPLSGLDMHFVRRLR
jgi:8-hydroxy-5-deazaflavin:NADPH oxidoreductase